VAHLALVLLVHFPVHPLLMPVVALVEILEAPLHLILLALVVAVMVEQVIHPAVLQRLIRVVVEVVVVIHQRKPEAMAALALSSSRPINNEDAWKLKSIGCMESTPQCTC
jgi:hypothetical protein